MKKSILTLLLIGSLCTASLISCGNNSKEQTQNNNAENVQDSSQNSSETETKENQPVEENSTSSEEQQNPLLIGENNKPSVTIKSIGSISDFKDKDEKSIKSLLGNPENKNDSVYTYVKDNFTFEVTYADSKCKKIKVIPKTDLKYPADAANILNLFGINAGEPDSMSPTTFSWNDKFDTSKITVTSDDAVENRIKDVEIVMD